MGGIFVAGSLHYDIVVTVPHLPVTDETVPASGVKFICGGKGGNQAIAAARHGASVTFAGGVGRDFFAEVLLENLVAHGVDIAQVSRHEDSASGMSVALQEERGDYGAVVASGSNQCIRPETIHLPADTALVIVQNEIRETVNLQVARMAKEMGCMVVCNAAPMRPMSAEFIDLIDVLIVNRVEGGALFDRTIDSIKAAKRAIAGAALPVPRIVLTLGDQGLVYRSMSQEAQFLAANAVNTVSNHGAGDCFVGALCAEYVRTGGFDQALAYGAKAAARLVSTPLDQRSRLDRDS